MESYKERICVCKIKCKNNNQLFEQPKCKYETKQILQHSIRGSNPSHNVCQYQ